MMFTNGSTPNCYPNGQQSIPTIYESSIHHEQLISAPSLHQPDHNSSPTPSQPSSFLYNLSILKDKVNQVQSLATIFLAPENGGQPIESTAVAMPTMGTLIQEIIVTASSMMFSCQQMSLGPPSTTAQPIGDRGPPPVERRQSSSSSGFRVDTVDNHWYSDGYDNNTGTIVGNNNHIEANFATDIVPRNKTEKNKGHSRTKNYNLHDIIELDAADLLAKYTHYCQVCGKGFKRDANLRMHMRAHGDEYKSAAALTNPTKTNASDTVAAETAGKKYSCPQEGCRWNRKHAKFQPLKSMICVKNHYKRSHCPKMYVCNRCGRKQFSVLSDLRTHEKHCGDLKWQCSCGTTFSRKDKLMGHVALFVGHSPAAAVNSLAKNLGDQSR